MLSSRRSRPRRTKTCAGGLHGCWIGSAHHPRPLRVRGLTPARTPLQLRAYDLTAFTASYLRSDRRRSAGFQANARKQLGATRRLQLRLQTSNRLQAPDATWALGAAIFPSRCCEVSRPGSVSLLFG